MTRNPNSQQITESKRNSATIWRKHTKWILSPNLTRKTRSKQNCNEMHKFRTCWVGADSKAGDDLVEEATNDGIVSRDLETEGGWVDI